MSFTILDGKGSGKEVSVDSNNRLNVDGVQQSVADFAADKGQRYNINTGSITLTSASESAVFYFKNNENYDYEINSFIYNLGASTSGVGEAVIDVYFKTTGGTVVSDETAVDMVANHNLGSANTLSANAYKGAEGKTQTGGTQAISSLVSPGSRAVVGVGRIVVPKGQTVAVTITPPTSNTSMTIQCVISGYLATPTVTGG